jgi:hypothetical protein
MSPDPSLRETQRHFRAAVLGGDTAPVAAVVRGADRIGVYRNTVQGSLIDVLATAFPVVRRIVADAYFAALARRFIAAAPPRMPHLSMYGDGFADFIAGADVGTRLPYLTDTARLEWARGECYFAADAAPLDTARLAALLPSAMEQTVLHPHPATRLIVSAYPIYRIWTVNQPEVTAVPPVDMETGEQVLVSRRGHHVVTRAITAGDGVFVSAAMAGETLGEAAAAAQKAEAGFDMQEALQAHFINGTFRD